MPEGEAGGFIVRTVAETASDEELKSDIEYLIKLWRGISEASKTAPPQMLLYQDLDLSLRVLRDLVTKETERIIVDSSADWGVSDPLSVPKTEVIMRAPSRTAEATRQKPASSVWPVFTPSTHGTLRTSALRLTTVIGGVADSSRSEGRFTIRRNSG